MQIPCEVAEKRWAARCRIGSGEFEPRRVELKNIAGFALIALEGMGCLTDYCLRMEESGARKKGASVQ